MERRSQIRRVQATWGQNTGYGKSRRDPSLSSLWSGTSTPSTGCIPRIGNAASQCFPGLFEVDRSVAKQQKLASAPSGRAIAIDQAPQNLECVWQTMNFVADDQLVIMACKIEFWFRQFGPIRLRLQIEISRGPAFANISCRCRITDLTMPQQRAAGLSLTMCRSSASILRLISHALMELCSVIARRKSIMLGAWLPDRFSA